jgi:hypothetical protein
MCAAFERSFHDRPLADRAGEDEDITSFGGDILVATVACWRAERFDDGGPQRGVLLDDDEIVHRQHGHQLPRRTGADCASAEDDDAH